MTFHNQRDYCVVKPFFTMIQKLLSCLDFPISACLDFPKYMELEFDSLPYQPAYRNLSFICVDLEGMLRASEFDRTLEVSFIYIFLYQQALLYRSSENGTPLVPASVQGLVGIVLLQNVYDGSWWFSDTIRLYLIHAWRLPHCATTPHQSPTFQNKPSTPWSTGGANDPATPPPALISCVCCDDLYGYHLMCAWFSLFQNV